ncbi:MAG: hypothetical protein JWN70_5977 [Planctomycetaceae bacterium]|nr:hypothetical protein [Planctomycetaceae bacterium]
MSTNYQWQRHPDDQQHLLWQSVIDATCQVRDLQLDAVCGTNRPSHLTAFVLKRERELLGDAFDLESALANAE